jgi:CRISPR-associated RAMP protein (TIGR02581 family)
MAVKRYTFDGVLVLDGALHVGSGGSGALADSGPPVDATVVRDSRGRPYVPGSSLRGVLRATIGQYAPSLGFGEIREDDKIKEAVEAVSLRRPLDEKGWLQLLGHPSTVLTPGERLFGTVYWASPLWIPDLYPLDAPRDAGEIRQGVGIDRDTGAAHEGAKYEFEVLPSGERFALHLKLEVDDESSPYTAEWLRLLALGLRLLELGEIRLGGRLARGLGQVRLVELAVYELDMGNRADLLSALRATDATGRYGRRLPADWARHALDEVA